MSANSRTRPNKQQLKWEWNIPLLIRSLCLIGGLSVVATALYFWQSANMASELLSQAKNSQDRGENKEQVKWLSRYVRLVPNDVGRLADLAFAVDSQESGPNQNVEFARSRLSAALVACGGDPEFEELRKSLRRKLIPRLLQFGVGKAAEAEQQVLLLAANENDAEVMKWIAQSLLMQRAVSEYQARDANQYDKGSDFWNWLAAQPTGKVLRMAVDANPDDVDLAASLLSVCNQRPVWFGTDSEAYAKAEIEELAKQTLERLSAKKDDGHAQLVVYVNSAISDREQANSILESALKPALERLSDFLGEPQKKNDSTSIERSASHPETLSPPKDYVPYWDWQIALEGSRIAGSAEAEKIVERLIGLASEKVATKQREEAFLRLAALRIEKADYEAAIDICKSGLTSIKQSSPLNSVIVFANLKLEKTEAAAKAINEIESDSELRLRQLTGALGIGMSTAEKADVRQQIEAEQWSLRLLKGQLEIVEKDYVKAIRLLRDAYKTTMSIAAESRVEAGLLLASCYSQTNQWDLAGQIFDECSILKPNDRSISVNAVKAWSRAGSSERANEQIGSLDDGSFSAALERALVIGSKPAAQLERRVLLSAIKTARARLDAVPVEDRSSLEPWRLELLELRFGTEDVKAPKEQEEDSLSRLEAIAERYADVGEVQSQAAMDLAAYGRLESSNLAISRLEQIAERTKKVEDRANRVLAEASVLVVKKDIDGAFQFLQNAIPSMPEQALRLAKVAAIIEIRAKRIDKAYAVLCSVPEESLDFEGMVMLAGMVDNLKIQDVAKADELIIKLDKWINRIKQAEGDDGTNWRYLAAERLLAKVSTETNNQQLLEQASAYYKEIDALRPHWGLASALGGKIASLSNASEEAITLWRRAIRNGDNRVSTVLDFVHELIKVKRGDQAEAELQRIADLADSVVPISALAVSFAVKRGDFSEALVRVEQLTTTKPEEIEGWLLRAQTAFAASSGLGLDDKSHSKLRDDAWTFLEKAHALSLGKNISVWDARFRFKLLSGDKTGASKILRELLGSSLPEEMRCIEAGRRYLLLKEYGSARDCFEKNLLMNPRSAEAYLGMADLHNSIGDHDASIGALRKAYQLAPSNQKIGERLALNLVFSQNEKIDWREVDSLISSTGMSTTSRSTLFGAFIGLVGGDTERQAKAVQTLSDLARSSTPERDDAKRFLADYFVMQWSINASANKSEEARENFESAQRLYEELVHVVEPKPMDAARFINFLLTFAAREEDSNSNSGVDYLAMAEQELKRLETATGSSIASLQLRIRLAKVRGEEATIGNIADNWVKGAGNLESLGLQNLWEITGQTLMQLGHSAESLTWLEKVYEKDPTKYGLLANALARERKYERAIELCVKAYHSDPLPITAKLIAEFSLMQPNVSLPGDASQILIESLTRFPDSAGLFEAVATLKLVQRRLPEAISLYERAEKNEPRRIRTLNNLAMALSEMPMRQQDALVKIEKAIEIYGRQPDLLDTLGQVQFRSGRLQEGLDTLIEACERKDDLAFRIHLAQVYMAKDDIASAKAQWSIIMQSKLDGTVLTPEEKEFLKLLNSQFGEKL